MHPVIRGTVSICLSISSKEITIAPGKSICSLPHLVTQRATIQYGHFLTQWCKSYR